MSSFFKPEISKPEPVKERRLTEVKARGRTGRSILAGGNKQEVQTQKKSILGG